MRAGAASLSHILTAAGHAESACVLLGEASDGRVIAVRPFRVVEHGRRETDICQPLFSKGLDDPTHEVVEGIRGLAAGGLSQDVGAVFHHLAVTVARQKEDIRQQRTLTIVTVNAQHRQKKTRI